MSLYGCVNNLDDNLKPIYNNKDIRMWLYKSTLIYYNGNSSAIMIIDNIGQFMGCKDIRDYNGDEYIPGINKKDYYDYKYNHNNIEGYDIRYVKKIISKYNIGIVVNNELNKNLKLLGVEYV